jgi:hypothetical protein
MMAAGVAVRVPGTVEAVAVAGQRHVRPQTPPHSSSPLSSLRLYRKASSRSPLSLQNLRGVAGGGWVDLPPSPSPPRARKGGARQGRQGGQQGKWGRGAGGQRRRLYTVEGVT